MSKRKQSTLDSSFFHPHARKAPRRSNTKNTRNGNSSRQTINADHPSPPSTQSPPSTSSSSKPHSISHNEDAPSKAAAQPATTIPNSLTHFPHKITLTTQKGDLFAIPPSTLLIHACNTRGTWGAGIAALFKSHYPAAFKIYTSHCTNPPSSSQQQTSKLPARKTSQPSPSLIGTALLIPPQTESATKREREARHFVACLFTSRNVGRNKDSADEILEATGLAVRDLLRQVRAWKAGSKRVKDKDRVEMGEMVMCKINSGLFGVEWERTKAVVEGIEIEGEQDVVITVMEKD